MMNLPSSFICSPALPIHAGVLLLPTQPRGNRGTAQALLQTFWAFHAVGLYRIKLAVCYSLILAEYMLHSPQIMQQRGSPRA